MMLLYNGHLLPDDALTLPLPNRGLLYGDGFFETLIVENDRLRLAADHLARMRQAAAALHLELPSALDTAEGLGDMLVALARANSLPNARLRLKLWRAGGGLYTPLGDAAEWLATADAFQENNMPIEQADFARETYSVASPLSFCKGPQAWLYVRAAHERQQRGLDEIILCDAAGHVAEAGAAAIFWLTDNVLYTPALASGCVAGVRRAAVLRAAAALGLPYREGLFKPIELLSAETVFTANVATLRPVRRVGAMRFASAVPVDLAHCGT
jgi:branched-chain amino acid aminotransferase